MRRLVLVIPLAALAAATAACGSNSTVSSSSDTPVSPSSSVSVPSTVTDTVVLPTTTAPAAPPSAAAPVACTTGNLTVSLGIGGGAAGSLIYPLHLTNKGTAACTVHGFAGVSFVAPSTGKQVGIAATRSTAVEPTITLASGAEATALLQVADYLNFPAATCAATAVSGFRVYPPDNTAAAYVALPTTTASALMACSGAPQLQVQPFTAGAGTS